MGLFSYEKPGTSRLSTQTRKYSAPSFSPGTNVGQFTPRGFPERVDASQFVPGGDIPAFIGEVVKTPARIYESPISAIAATQEGSDLLDGFANTVKSIPGIGPILGGAADGGAAILDGLWNAKPALDNSFTARWLKQNANLPDDAPFTIDGNTRIDGEILRSIGAGQFKTVGDYRRHLAQMGWTAQDIADLQEGRKSEYDFGDAEHQAIPGAGDMVYRMLNDPLNLLLPLGISAKGATGARLGLKAQEAARVSTEGYRAVKPLGIAGGVSAIASGTWRGVTTRSLSTFVNGWVRGSGPVFRGYRNVALGTYGATMAGNVAAQVIPQEWSSEVPILEDVLDYFKRVDEERPLSDNGMFILGSILKFPARDIVGSGYKTLRGNTIRAMRREHEAVFYSKLGGKQNVVQRLGSQESADALMYQTARAAAFLKAQRQSLRWLPPALTESVVGSLPELGHKLAGLNRFVARKLVRAFDDGSISGADFEYAMEQMFRRRGDVVTGATGGVERQFFDADGFLKQWSEFEPIARHLSDTFDDMNVLVPGVSDEFGTTSQLDWVTAMLEDAAVDGVLSAKVANDILMEAPVLFRMGGKGRIFSKTLTRSADDVQFSELRAAITEAKSDPRIMDASDAFAADAEWNRAAERTLSRTQQANQVLRNGQADTAPLPDYGHTVVTLPTQEFTIGMRRRAPVDSLEQIQMLRARPGTVNIERNVPQALAEGGYQIDSAGRVAFIGQGGTAPGFMETGMVLRIPDNADFQTLSEIAAHALGESSSRKASVIISGADNIRAHGLDAPNAMEFRWDAPMAAENADDIIRVLRNEFGERVMVNDKTGAIRVVVRTSDNLTNLDTRLQRVNTAVGVEPARQPAFVQDIVKRSRSTDAAGTRTTKSVADIAAPRSHRWHFTKERLAARRGRDMAADAGGVADGGVAGRGPSGPTPTEVLDRGLGANDISGSRRATRWERSRAGREAGGLGDEHVASPRDAGEYQGRVRDAAAGDARTGAIAVPDDAARYWTADRKRGAYVTSTGRLHVWGAGRPDDWNTVLAAASDRATYAIVPDITGRGRNLLDDLGDHGWRVVAKSEDDLVYLVRDPNGITGAQAIPRRSGGSGWATIKNDVPRWTDEVATATVREMRERHLGISRPEGYAGGQFVGEGRTVELGGQTLRAEPGPYRPPEALGSDYESVRNVMYSEDAGSDVYLYRSISEEDWQRIQRQGYMDTDARMNLDPNEGMGAGDQPSTFYLPGNLRSSPMGDHPGRIVRIARREGDSWVQDARDGYWKTNERVPIEDIDLVSPEITTRVTEARYGGKTSETIIGPAQTRPEAVAARRRNYAAREAGEVPGPYDKIDAETGVFAQVNGDNTAGGNTTKIHVSATPQNAARVLEIVSNVAEDANITFKWVKNLDELADGADFGRGGIQQGKFITLYPDDYIARQVAERLDDAIRFSDDVNGDIGRAATPEVPNDVRFSDDGIVFHRREGGSRDVPGGDYAEGQDIIGVRRPQAQREAGAASPVTRLTPEDVSLAFEADVQKAARQKVAVPLRMRPEDGPLGRLFDIAEGMGIKFDVVGWGDNIAEFDPFNKKINLGRNFPMRNEQEALDILTHEVGHNLRYGIKDIPKELGDWVPEGTMLPDWDRPVKAREVFAINKPGGVEYSFGSSEAFADAFADYVMGRPMAPEAEAYMRSLAPERPQLGGGATSPEVRANDQYAIHDDDALTFLWNADEEAAQFVPKFHESVTDTLPESELMKVAALEAELKRTNPQYTLKVAPQNATPYFTGQGDAWRAITAGRRMAADDWMYNHVSAPLTAAKEMLFSPVYSKTLNLQARQELYNQFLNAGASRTEVDQFLNALQKQWEHGTPKTPKFGVHWIRSADKLMSGTIDDIAWGRIEVEGFKGFDRKVLQEVAQRGDTITEMVRRSGSRTYRNLSKKFPAKDGKGNLGKIIDQMYGVDRSGVLQPVYAAARGGTYGIKTMYHLMRFIADPRWYLMNTFEADILGIARSGLRASRLGGAREVDRVTGRFAAETPPSKLMQSRSGTSEFTNVEDVLEVDALASGWLDPRKLGGYVGAAFDTERPQTTIRVLQKMVDGGDPVIDDLISKFGGNTDDWVRGLDDLMYNIDTKGARKAVLDEAAELRARGELVWNGKEPRAWQDFLDGLWQEHQRNFKDIMHVFHGNVNRSNIERLLNSPLLWWPLSYQLKAGKWVIDTMTYKMGGAQTDLLGAWTLNHLMARHSEAYRTDQDYAAQFDEHPAMWRTLGMMLPMTPFDMGVFMARWTRYSGSWVGSQLGLWDEDSSYPQDPVNFINRSVQLGPYFTLDLMDEILREYE